MVTPLYAGLLAILYFKISIEVINGRRSHQISLGYGPNNEIAGVVSAHSNFAAYVPLLLILTFFVEASNLFPKLILHGVCMLYVVGRVSHYMSLRSKKMNPKFRVLGMHLTFWPMLALAGMNIFIFIKQSF